MSVPEDRLLVRDTEAPAGEQTAPRAYAQVGERVAGVLQAAEDAAEKMREDARRDAAEIRREAESTGTRQLEQMAQEAESVRLEAETYSRETREAVDTYATQRRRETESESSRALAEAEGQARATREAAEAMAKRIEDAARQRQQTLLDESRTVEVRMQRAIAGFRAMAAQLEELLAASSAGNGGRETLVDALEVERRRLPSA